MPSSRRARSGLHRHGDEPADPLRGAGADQRGLHPAERPDHAELRRLVPRSGWRWWRSRRRPRSRTERGRWPQRLVWLIPLVDILAVGALRLVPENGGVGVLVVLPAMWLGVDHRERGVLLTALAIILTVSVPQLVYFGLGADSWSRAVLLPVIAANVAMAGAALARMWTRQSHRLAIKHEELEKTYEHEQQVAAQQELIAADHRRRPGDDRPQRRLHLAEQQAARAAGGRLPRGPPRPGRPGGHGLRRGPRHPAGHRRHAHHPGAARRAVHRLRHLGR